MTFRAPFGGGWGGDTRGHSPSAASPPPPGGGAGGGEGGRGPAPFLPLQVHGLPAGCPCPDFRKQQPKAPFLAQSQCSPWPLQPFALWKVQ
jgi:hypothetical protein